jgi:hypothetical protein
MSRQMGIVTLIDRYFLKEVFARVTELGKVT